MFKATYTKYTLTFKSPAGTSRGTYTKRDSWFITIWDTDNPACKGIGECAPLPGLSADWADDYLPMLDKVCRHIGEYVPVSPGQLKAYPSIQFGLETAFKDLESGGVRKWVDNSFTQGLEGLPINGLIWMGSPDSMRDQIAEKTVSGFNCIKMKIGALDFNTELDIIKEVRTHLLPENMVIRVDANGAFKPGEAMEKLKRLAELQVHSIEQPIMAGQEDDMARLCETSPIPIVLDEELIGIDDKEKKKKILDKIRPQYLVLKPTLHGGMSGCDDWIELADNQDIAWWATSALESNIGLNAISQWVSEKKTYIAQGLGTGQLFTNNLASPLVVDKGQLWYLPAIRWDLTTLKND